jgi:hypothetical protein
VLPFGSMLQTSHGERTPREGAGQVAVLLLDQGQLPYQNLCRLAVRRA